jgi:hypothetical protein
MYFDFLILPEIHSLPHESIDLENYKIFQFNRPNQGNARRGSGGIAIAIHVTVLDSHVVLSVNKGLDGQLSIKLKNLNNDFLVGILALYLPPDNYMYGQDPENFYNNAAVLWEDLFDCDLLIGGGDLNSRVKDMLDYIPDIDGKLIPSRKNPDRIKNKHGDCFISFLKDNRSLILNGRITPQFNNYTFVSTRGCSVPDFLFCPVDQLVFCTEMKTILMSDIVNDYNLPPPNSLPDHSILKGTFHTSYFDNNSRQLNYPLGFPQHLPINNSGESRPPKPNLNKMPSNFFMTDEIHGQVLETITKIENVLQTQISVDQLWSEIKSLFILQLDKLPTLPSSNNKKQNKLFRKSQPFWNADLANLWASACQAEKSFLSFKVQSNQDFHQKSLLREEYKNKQKIFDKKFREVKRLHKKQDLNNLQKNAVSDPASMWATLKKLSNPPSNKAVLEIVRADETISRDIKEILEKWQSEISKLFSGVRENPEMAFDENFFQEIINKKNEFENLSPDEQVLRSTFSPEMVNADISFDEVSKAVNSTKMKKAYLDIPNEAFKNENAKHLLHNFFNLCFKSGLNPTDWDFSDIKPIPKKDKDPREPLQNRCISIICCVAKLYSRILNSRVQKYLESNEILVEEQNGFRSCRSCIDHLFVLVTVLRNRKLSGQETFLSFIDYKKAFDSVERHLLLFKLSEIGIVGNMYRAISSLYSNPRSRVILNEYETDFFQCPIGVKQGDCLSPTLFAIFINDLATEIKASNIGLQLDQSTFLNILLYADDIVLLAGNEEDLQSLLFIVETWCKRWRLEINLSKTNIMHVRGVRKKQSNFMFLFDMRPIAYCKEYKYLGATINEFLDFNFTAECLADSAGRALGSIVTKMIKNGGFPFNVYSILYEACVTSIADYSGEVFGYNQHQPTLKLHLRAIRAFLGLPKTSCNVGVLSEVDWVLPQYRTRMKMIRMFNRIIKMDENRLTRKIFNWDRQLNESNTVLSWSNEVKSIFSECNMNSFYENINPFAVKCTVTKMHEIFLSKQQNY